MRIWFVHPKYLDGKGLVALWREALLAKNVLENKTTGYKNQPQLRKFKESEKPLQSINHYLEEIYNEARKRDYSFNACKINLIFKRSTVTVTRGQLRFEPEHLKRKLQIRDVKKFKEINAVRT